MRLNEIIKNNIFRDLELDDIPAQLYHGTSIEVEIGGLILPPDQTDVISEKGRKKNLNLVFLTPNFNYAKIYAGRSARSIGGNPVVYEVRPVGAKLFKKGPGDTIWTCEYARVVKKYNVR